jgi:hypothetical protein
MLVVIMLIVFPLLRPTKINRNITDEIPWDVLTEKDTILTTLNEIEFDYQMQKLAEDDYLFLKNKYKQMAMEILKAEEELLSLDDASNEEINAIEAEIEVELLKFKEST